MKNKKVLATALAGCLVMSLAACSKTSKEDKEIISAAETYIDAVLNQEVEDIIDLSSGITTDKVTNYVTFSSSKEDVCDAILSATECKIDKKSVEVDGKTATIDVTFVMPDYEAVADDDDYEDDDDIIDQLEDADELEIEVTIEFKNKKDEWLVTNTDEVLAEAFAYNVEYPFSTALVGEYKGNMDEMGINIDVFLTINSDDTCEFTIDATEAMKELAEDLDIELTDEDYEDCVETMEGTYTVDGDEAVFTFIDEYGDEDVVNGKIDGDVITLYDTESDDEIVLKKV